MDSHSDRRAPSGGGPGRLPGPERRAEMLREGWRRLQEEDHAGMMALLERLPEEAMLQEPELVYLLASALCGAGRESRALPLLRRVTGAGEEHADSRLLVRCLDLEGEILLSLGELPAAGQCYRKVLEAGVPPRDESLVAAASVRLGIIAGVQGRHAEALASFQRALASLHRLGLEREVGSVHHYLGMTFRQLGRADEALSSLLRAREICERHGSAADRVRLGIERALVARLAGDHRLARASARSAHQLSVGLRRERLSAAAPARGVREEARHCFGRSPGPARASHHPLLEAEILEELAVLEQAEGDEEWAETLAERSAAIYQRIGTPARARRVWERLSPIGAATPYGAGSRGRPPYD